MDSFRRKYQRVIRSGYILQPYLAELIILLDKLSDETNDIYFKMVVDQNETEAVYIYLVMLNESNGNALSNYAK